MNKGKYWNLKDLISDYANGYGLNGIDLKKRIQESYDENEISDHGYDDLIQYLDLEVE